MSFAVSFKPSAARQVQRERAWLSNNVGIERADDFEHELRTALGQLAECPAMGPPSPWSEDERRVFLRRSRFHVFYRLYPEAERIVIMRLRHEKQRAPKALR